MQVTVELLTNGIKKMNIFRRIVLRIKDWLTRDLMTCTHSSDKVEMCIDDAPNVVEQCIGCDEWIVNNKITTFTKSKHKPKYHTIYPPILVNKYEFIR